jgi:hypothetical protein
MIDIALDGAKLKQLSATDPGELIQFVQDGQTAIVVAGPADRICFVRLSGPDALRLTMGALANSDIEVVSLGTPELRLKIGRVGDANSISRSPVDRCIIISDAGASLAVLQNFMGGQTRLHFVDLASWSLLTQSPQVHRCALVAEWKLLARFGDGEFTTLAENVEATAG